MLIWLCPLCCDKWRTCAKGRVDKCFWNGVLTVIDASFLVFIITAMINVYKASVEKTVPKDIYYVLSIVCLVVCLVEILACSIFLKLQIKHLDEEKNLKRCGYLYEELNYRIRGAWALSYPILY